MYQVMQFKMPECLKIQTNRNRQETKNEKSFIREGFKGNM